MSDSHTSHRSNTMHDSTTTSPWTCGWPSSSPGAATSPEQRTLYNRAIELTTNVAERGALRARAQLLDAAPPPDCTWWLTRPSPDSYDAADADGAVASSYRLYASCSFHQEYGGPCG